ncbi:MAG: SprT-like domain-containing protein [Candidatus Eremiobacteraeota bacterium]|nr:SprT-like domain-containing protein [Candidatus Eremiobacteraeota bacterium]
MLLPSETDLQLLFAELNNYFFNGEIAACRIRYNARFSNSAGRITYNERPLLLELSPKHFQSHPQALRETLLHEMIHAWLFGRCGDTGHGSRFKKKMRECGLTSIYHDLGSAAPIRESAKRYILRCERCTVELLRRRRPTQPMSCGRCSRRGYDPRFPLAVYEVIEMRPAGTTAPARAACDLGRG